MNVGNEKFPRQSAQVTNRGTGSWIPDGRVGGKEIVSSLGRGSRALSLGECVSVFWRGPAVD